MSAVALEFPDVEVSAARTSAGRGAAWQAVALAVALASAPGGIHATWRVFSRIFNHLQSRGEHPSMSIGAIRHLCLADLLQSHPDLKDADVIDVVATEVAPPGPPGDLGHTGRDMFMVIFVKADNSCTWVYLVDGYGQVLHMGQGAPLTLDLAFESGLSPEVWSTGTHRYLADPGSR